MWDSELELKGSELEYNIFFWKDSKYGDRNYKEKGQNAKEKYKWENMGVSVSSLVASCCTLAWDSQAFHVCESVWIISMMREYLEWTL